MTFFKFINKKKKQRQNEWIHWNSLLHCVRVEKKWEKNALSKNRKTSAPNNSQQWTVVAGKHCLHLHRTDKKWKTKKEKLTLRLRICFIWLSAAVSHSLSLPVVWAAFFVKFEKLCTCWSAVRSCVAATACTNTWRQATEHTTVLPFWLDV